MTDNDELDVKSPEEVIVYSFRWRYIIVPLIILVVSVILAAIFYSRLPDEVAWMFASDGLASRVGSRGAVVLWILVIQLVHVLGAGVITRGIAAMYNRYVQPDTTGIQPGKVISFMGNVIALPQIIIFFTMLDIFSYNSYEKHLLPLWLIAVLVLVIGGLILGIFFIRSLLQIWKANKE